MLHNAMKGRSKPLPSMGGRFKGVKINRCAYWSDPRKMKKIDVEGIMLVMKINVCERRLFFNRSLVKIAASASARIISRGTVSRKYPREPNRLAPASLSRKKRK